jgi:hypothetical protein
MGGGGIGTLKEGKARFGKPKSGKTNGKARLGSAGKAKLGIGNGGIGTLKVGSARPGRPKSGKTNGNPRLVKLGRLGIGTGGIGIAGMEKLHKLMQLECKRLKLDARLRLLRC